MSRLKRRLALPSPVLLLALLLLLPFVYLFGLAGVSLLQAPQALTHLASTILPDLVWQTVYLCFGVVVLTSTMGVLPAWWVSAHEFPGRRWLEWLLLLPLAMQSPVPPTSGTSSDKSETLSASVHCPSLSGRLDAIATSCCTALYRSDTTARTATRAPLSLGKLAGGSLTAPPPTLAVLGHSEHIVQCFV